MQLTAVDSPISSGAANGPNTRTCAGQPKEVAALVARLSGAVTGDLSVACNGHKWKVAGCDLTGNTPPSVCVDCIDPCDVNVRCGSTNSTGASFSIAGCDRPLSCNANSYIATQSPHALRFLSVTFKERSPPPSILSVTLASSTRTEANVSVVLTDAGSVYCAAFLADGGAALSSLEDVVMQVSLSLN